MHAKMTRDRKKNFISTIEKTIEKLESKNSRMKKILQEFIQLRLKSGPNLTPMSSPDSVSVIASPEKIPTLDLTDDASSPPAKRTRIGI